MKSSVKSRPLHPSAHGCASHVPLQTVTFSLKDDVPVCTQHCRSRRDWGAKRILSSWVRPGRTGHTQQRGLDAVGWSNLPHPPPWIKERRAWASLPTPSATPQSKEVQCHSSSPAPCALGTQPHPPHQPPGLHAFWNPDRWSCSQFPGNACSISPPSFCTSCSLCLHTFALTLLLGLSSATPRLWEATPSSPASLSPNRALPTPAVTA